MADAHLLHAPLIRTILRRTGLPTDINSFQAILAHRIYKGSDESEGEIAETEADAGSGPDDRLPIIPLPDTYREAAAIQGLAIFGARRLPLDNILRLLASRVLWEAFYKRVYTWYHSLDVTQEITEADVEAVILSTYPGHTANEFITRVSAHFSTEVAQAVNFAATLPQYGWQGPRLYLHQADAARRIAEVLAGQSEQPFILNADDPGLGKTMALLAAVCASGVRRVLIVAPKTVADDTWYGSQADLRRCLPAARSIRGLDAALTAPPTDGLTLYILHYEELRVAAQTDLANWTFDCLCLDEIHALKRRTFQEHTPHQRRAALQQIRNTARTIVGFTGTPLVNELAEPISLLQILSRDAEQFQYTGLSSQRLDDIADVFEMLLPHIIRRRRAEVLLHLPACEVRTVPIPMPPDLDQQLKNICQQSGTTALVDLHKLAIEAKLGYILQRAMSTGKLLVLTYLHKGVSERITSYLEDFFPAQVGHINGDTPKAERQHWLESFRAPTGIRVLVGTLGTTGIGLTLFDPTQRDGAHEILMADLPYTWAEFDQGIARLHREGQQQRVQVEVLLTTTETTLNDSTPLPTLDEAIWKFILAKRELGERAIDGHHPTTDTTIQVRKALQHLLQQARKLGLEPWTA